MHVWEHSRLPICALQGATPATPNLPWPFTDPDAPNHYPEARHLNRFNVLFCDGHVVPMSISELTIPLFYVYDPSP
nr:H-X9-DG-CTERM domain-containing protein [Telmatocola sphagniphila]